MKNLSIVLNAVLLIAVGVLYYLHFSTTKTKKGPETNETKDLAIAYINSDTVLKYYDYFNVNKDRLEARGKKMDQDLQGRAQNLQNEFQSYQRNASTLTMGQARAVEEDLGKKRQNLQMYQESLSQEMLMEQEKLTKDLRDRVTNYLAKYSEQNGLKVVLKYDATSDLLFGTGALNISKEVIAGLNDEYKAELTKTPSKKDTTQTKKK
jgi:outer membrane protein